MSKNILLLLFLFIVGIIGGIFADQILWPYFIEKPLFLNYRLEQTPVYLTEKTEITITENQALESAIEKTEKVIVGIKNQSANTLVEGSGLIITSDGLMVTLAELVPPKSTPTFYIDNKAVSFQILKRDTVKNLVLVKLDISNIPTVSFADIDKLQLGERVFLTGLTFKKKENVTIRVVNEGIVRSINSDSIQTSIEEKANLKGSSLFNINAEVIGINTIDSDNRIITIPASKIKEFAGL